MRHFIIVKFDNSIYTQKLIKPIKNLFNKVLKLDGVNKIEVHTLNTNLPNRHDLMIEMLLTPTALDLFDISEIHKMWKSEYEKYIVNKTIFDYD